MLGVFFVIIVAASYLASHSISETGYTRVGIRTLSDEPLPLEGRNISSSATAISVVDQGSYSLIDTEEGVYLVVPKVLGVPVQGDHVLFRGTSWVASNGTVTVHEFHVLDASSSVIRSVPGIIVFVIMFFAVFSVDMEQLAFIVRREQSA